MSPVTAGTFWGIVAARAAATPDLVALEDDLGRSLTFGQLAASAEAVAAGLVPLGATPGAVVSWQLPTCLESAVLTVALARLGVVQQPIIHLLREREVAHLTAAVGPALLVVPTRWRGFEFGAMAERLAAEQGFAVLHCDHREAAGSGRLALPVGDPANLPPPPVDGRADRWRYSTSGTSGAPKGVRHCDAAILAAPRGFVTELRLGPDDAYPIAFPLAHIGGAAMLAAQAMAGHRLLLMDSFEPAAASAFLAEKGATVLGSALPFLRAFMDAQLAHGAEPLWPRLRACMSGGAAKPEGLHAEVRRVLGGRGVLSSWGLTEFPMATHASLDDLDEDLDDSEGRPCVDVEVRAVASDGTVCPPGVEGELRLRGPQLFLGYVDPADDAGALDDEGFFRTGDLGVIGPRGHVRITGRVKDVIIRNAENISAREVEDVLATHPDVADIAVVGLPDARTGERACAVVVVRPGATVTLDDLGRHGLAHGLARFKLPEQLVLVDEIPRSGLGKVAKHDLRTALLQGR